MMQFETQTPQTLHDEHMKVDDFLRKFELELVKHKVEQPPTREDTVFINLLGDLIVVVENELIAHFKFEEDELFPLLIEDGIADMPALLLEEHKIILPIALRLCEMAKTIRREGCSQDLWHEFRRLGLELVERLSGHIQKEEMGLVPMLESILEQEQDIQLTDSYALMR